VQALCRANYQVERDVLTLIGIKDAEWRKMTEILSFTKLVMQSRYAISQGLDAGLRIWTNRTILMVAIWIKEMRNRN
jgi:hypothetical protein